MLTPPLPLPILYTYSEFHAGPAWAISTMPRLLLYCPVLGCEERSDRWGKRSYPLPSLSVFTLTLVDGVDVSISNRICQPCWKRHKDPTMGLDGRIRVVPPAPSSSPLDALLSAISPSLLAATSPPSHPSLSSTSPSSLPSPFFSPPLPPASSPSTLHPRPLSSPLPSAALTPLLPFSMCPCSLHLQ